MSRQQDEHGVVLTGYFSNSEALPSASINCADDVGCPVSRISHVDLSPESSCHHVLVAGSLLTWREVMRGAQRETSRKSDHCNVPGRAKNVRGGTPYTRCGSQDSLDELSLDDYWKEVEDIHRSSGGDAEQQEEVQLKVADEGEREEAWLTEAGLATLFDESASDPEDSMALLSTLTRTQAAAVEKRVETLKQTLRKKNKTHHVPDVREIFNLPGAQRTQAEGAAPVIGRSENGKGDVKSRGDSVCENGAGTPESETHINVEISFSEQALLHKEASKGSEARAQSDVDDKLPNFKVSKDKTGITKVGDLAPQDMKKVHRLALIEMTALFDTAGIELKTHKALRVKVKESGLFGVPLSTLLEQDQKRLPGTKVPLILQRLISHIENEGLGTEGLLRVPGVATRVKAACLELDARFYEGTFAWEALKQHDAISILKLFIRELPHPLLTVEYLSAFTSVLKLPTKNQQLQVLNLLVLLLPAQSRDTLKALLEFFQRVIDHKEQNKMTLNNIAVVMAPNIFTFKGFRSKASEQQEFTMATWTAHIVRLLIQYQHLLWTIPRFIINQVRKQNMENQKKLSRDKAVKKLLKKMASDRERQEKSPAEEGLIRIQAPQFPKVSMAVQLTDDLQVADILARFVSQESALLGKREDYCLYEVGGNINERCLDGEAYVKNVIELNPSAEWVIKAVRH